MLRVVGVVITMGIGSLVGVVWVVTSTVCGIGWDNGHYPCVSKTRTIKVCVGKGFVTQVFVCGIELGGPRTD